MKYEQVKKIVNGAVENEFNHVQEFKEVAFEDNDKRQIGLHNKTMEIMDKLMEVLPEEQKDLLSDLYDAFVLESTNLCKFYFKEGVRSGLVNLKYINEIKYIESFL